MNSDRSTTNPAPLSKPPIDTANKWLVGIAASGAYVTIMRPSSTVQMTPEDALVLAAYLVLMAEPSARVKFADAMEAVQNA